MDDNVLSDDDSHPFCGLYGLIVRGLDSPTDRPFRPAPESPLAVKRRQAIFFENLTPFVSYLSYIVIVSALDKVREIWYTANGNFRTSY